MEVDFINSAIVNDNQEDMGQFKPVETLSLDAHFQMFILILMTEMTEISVVFI